MSQPKSKIRKYQLIKFIGDVQDEEALLPIDRVPCHWVRYDAEVGHIVAKFPPPPYTEHTYRLLETLIKTEGAPMSSWPEYPVDLVGHADTYKDSVKRLGVLETEPYAFTTDTDVEPRKKAAEIIEEIKIQSLEALMKVPAIENEALDRLDSSFDQDYDSQTSSEETTSSRKKIKKIKKVKGKLTLSVKPQVQKKKYVKPLRGKSEPKQHPVESTKAQNKVKEHVSQKRDIKPRKNNAAVSARSQSPLSNADIANAHFVEVSGEIREPEQNPIESAKVQNRVGEYVPQTKVDEPRSNDAALPARSQSALTNLDVAGAYFVQESGELILAAEVDSNQHERVFSTAKRQAASVLHKSSAFDKSLKKATETLQQAEKEYSKDTMLLMSTLKGLSLDLKDNTRAINNLCAEIQNNKTSVQGEMTQKALVLESHFDLPFETVEVFKEFDCQLEQDAKYRKHCAASLLFYIDPDNHVSKSMTNIIKKFVGRDVAMNFTAVKQTSKKEVLKGTKFYDIMFEVLTRHHTDKQGNPICEKYFNQCLGHALANAKDWDGFRVERAKKELEKKRLAQEEEEKKADEAAQT